MDKKYKFKWIFLKKRTVSFKNEKHWMWMRFYCKMIKFLDLIEMKIKNSYVIINFETLKMYLLKIKEKYLYI